jgi:protein involved in polysaccharide export with SLBB domain
VLILTGDVESAYTLDVTREGFVVIPQVGQVPVANLTLGQLEDLLYSRLGRVYSGVRRGPGASTRFSVSLARLRTNRVFLVGDVARPGAYQIPATGTAFTALYQAGGPSENGTLRRIEIRRGGRTVDVLDVYDYLLRGDASRDVRLQSGDVVFVPVRGAYVRVTGEVIRPATYELKPQETLADVVRAAGGFTATAARTRVQIERILPPAQRGTGGRDRVVIDISSSELATGEGPAYALQAGDVVRVFPIADRVRNRVTVLGNVWAPGSQGFAGQIRLSDALRLAGGVKPDTYLGRVLITRLRPDSSRVQLRATLRDTTGTVVDDPLLQEDDEVRVFSLTDFRPDRYVAITGAVRNGGQFAYREGMTVRDLVLLAGGVQESAYLAEAELARLPDSRTGGVTATTIRVALDSTYLFERTSDGRYLGPPGIAAPRGVAPEVPLLPYDNVLILQQPDWELQRNVTVRGEVRFPGTYAVTRKNERLSDVIKRAGGLTSEAYAGGTVFTRSRNAVGRIGLDVPAVLRNGRHVDNLLLQDGDSVFVPRFNAVVTVRGAVNSPVAVAYAPGQDLSYYVRSAGGPAGNADLGRGYVTQPNGKVESVQRRRLLPDGIPTPRPGSVVVVPTRPSPGLGILGAANQTTQLLAGLATAIGLILALRR